MTAKSRKNLRCITIFILIIIIGLATSNAQSSKFLNVEILKEIKREYSSHEVMSTQLPFEVYNEDQAPQRKDSYWLRFTYIKTDPSKQFYLFRPFLLSQRLDLYYKLKGRLHHHETGLELPFDKRHLFLPNLYLPLPNTADTTVCYLHVKSFYGYSFFFAERDAPSLIKEEYNRASMEYFYIGLGFLSIIFSLLFYIYLKEKVYLYYSLFTMMLVLARMTFSGIIFNYINGFYNLTSLDSIFNLYAISYAGINIALLLYFHEYFRFYERSKSYHRAIYSIIAFRLLLLLFNDYIPANANVYADIMIQCFLLVLAIRTSRKYFRQSLLTILSLAILIFGNLIVIYPDFNFTSADFSYYVYLNLAGLEVVVFAIGLAYRNYFLKQEHEKAVAKTIEALRESESLKESANREL
ncbi:MAG TPA: 7TM diverse intracellular signaling domain-containing protein, partial [Cytophagaceae bacterium]